MSLTDELQKLEEMKESGTLSEDEYQRAKKALLDQDAPAGARLGQAARDLSSDVNTWAMFVHLSQLVGYAIPLAGFILPIVLWQIKKDDSAVIDQHGRIVANWVITELILAAIFFALCFVFIGIPLLLALMVAGLAFPILGGIKANNGEVWPYPLSIKFFPID